MCWVTYKEKYLKRKTAEKNIKVKKLLERNPQGNLSSPIFEFNWRIGKTYVSSIDQPIPYLRKLTKGYIGWQINKGLHSCKHIAMTKHWVYCFSTWWFIPINVKLLSAREFNYEIHREK